MITIQQGEILQYMGRVLRRVKGSTDYEVIEDLTPYNIVISLMKRSLKDEVLRFRVYKGDSMFYTEQIETSTLKALRSYEITAAIVVNDVTIVANNTAPLTIEASKLGESLPSEVVDYGDASITSGTIDSGEWEYQIELAYTGSDAAINGWNDSSEPVALAIGAIIAGEPFPYVQLTESEYAVLEVKENKLYIVTSDE